MEGEHPTSLPSLLFTNDRGEIVEYDGLQMAADSSGIYYRPALDDLIALPEGSELFTLPGRLPVGFEPGTDTPAMLDEDPYQGGRIQAVAAFMAPAYTTLGTAAYVTPEPVTAPILPLFAYTAVGWHEGKFWVTGFRSDRDARQDAYQFNQRAITRKTKKKLEKFPKNRLIQHLGNCCLTYCCPAARNYFLERWEAPLPCSPACNAECIGCISLQPSGCCASTQDRIKFVPKPHELAEVAIGHINTAPDPIVSFGQGCEGEPLLQSKVIEKSIRMIRAATDCGTINLNTNGSLPHEVERLAHAGLDSIRISMNSAQPEKHALYYRPKGFSFDEVRMSIKTMKQYGRHVSLNYFIFPGFTDDPEESFALLDLVADSRPDFIQLRNLNMDPELYRKAINHFPTERSCGIRSWLASLKKAHPALKFGYFNPRVD